MENISWLLVLAEIAISFAVLLGFSYGIGMLTVYYYYLTTSKDDFGDGYR